MNDNDLKILRALNTLKECLDGDDPRFSDELHEDASTFLDKAYRLSDFFENEICAELGIIKPKLIQHRMNETAESLIEQLPKTVEYNGVSYQLRIYISFWDNLVIAYREMSPKDDRIAPRQILSYVVEFDKDPKVAENFGPEDKTYINDSIGHDTTLAKCVKHIMNKLEQHKDVIKIKN